MTSARVKICIVGLRFGRHIVEQVARGVGREFVELAGVCDLQAELAGKIAAEFGVPAYSRLEDVLALPDLPAVGLFTGPVGRAELIREIVRTGKHVMTTKPFELDAAAAGGVLAEAARLGRVVHLNSPGPVAPPDIAQIQQWVREYNLGRPVGCRAETWASYREQADGRWYDNPKLCPVAPVFRLGIYLINDLVTLFGEAQQVQVLHARLFTGRPTPDNAQAGIQFANGALANVFASFCIKDEHHYRNSLVVNYENGTIFRNAGPAEGKETVLELVAAGGARAQARFADHSGQYDWAAFQRAVRGQPLANPTSSTEIVAGIRIMTALSRAETSGRTEAV